jgi:hypothetical protein
MAAQDVAHSKLLAGTGIRLEALDDPVARISHQEKVAPFRNILPLSRNRGIVALGRAACNTICRRLPTD